MRFSFIIFIIFINITLGTGQIYGGLKLGQNISKQSYSTSGTSKNVYGVDLGLFAETNIWKGIFLRSDFSFLQNGGNQESTFSKYKIKSNHFEVSLVSGYKLKVKKLTFFANFGVLYDFLISEKTEGNPFINFGYVNIEDNKTNSGLIYGGGIAYNLKRGKIGFNIRFRNYDQRFRIIMLGTHPTDLVSNTIIKNEGIGMTLEYSVPLSSKY